MIGAWFLLAIGWILFFTGLIMGDMFIVLLALGPWIASLVSMGIVAWKEFR